MGDLVEHIYAVAHTIKHDQTETKFRAIDLLLYTLHTTQYRDTNLTELLVKAGTPSQPTTWPANVREGLRDVLRARVGAEQRASVLALAAIMAQWFGKQWLVHAGDRNANFLELVLQHVRIELHLLLDIGTQQALCVRESNVNQTTSTTTKSTSSSSSQQQRQQQQQQQSNTSTTPQQNPQQTPKDSTVPTKQSKDSTIPTQRTTLVHSEYTQPEQVVISCFEFAEMTISCLVDEESDCCLCTLLPPERLIRFQEILTDVMRSVYNWIQQVQIHKHANIMNKHTILAAGRLVGFWSSVETDSLRDEYYSVLPLLLTEPDCVCFLLPGLLASTDDPTFAHVVVQHKLHLGVIEFVQNQQSTKQQQQQQQQAELTMAVELLVRVFAVAPVSVRADIGLVLSDWCLPTSNNK